MITPELVKFHIEIPVTWEMVEGCPPEHDIAYAQGQPVMTCRSCNVGVTAMTTEGLQFTWSKDAIRRLVVLDGEYPFDNDGARLAVARLMAFAQRHPDPLDLMAQQKGYPTLWL